jgi:hypothetical protein
MAAKKFIHYYNKKNHTYAAIYDPKRINGKKVNIQEHLGRVVDKDNNIFKSLKRGLFKFTLDNGYELLEQKQQSFIPKREKLILTFGDAYVLYKILEEHKFLDILRPVIPAEFDTFMAMIMYKVLAHGSNVLAEDWYNASYVKILFPNAKVSSPRISEFYKQLGDESVHRIFFKNYLPSCVANNKLLNILIDSTGLPNEINFDLSEISNHNGDINRETRLIYVIDRISGTPLYFRYNAGNIVDVSTLKATILELKVNDIDVDNSILDAGYYSEKNIMDLYKAGIHFVTRLNPNRTIYKELVNTHELELQDPKYYLYTKKRWLSVKCVPIDLFGYKAYAYICIDQRRKFNESENLVRITTEDKKINENNFFANNHKAFLDKGIFILISSKCIDRLDIIPLYYTRQTIEQLFDTSKNNVDQMPVRVHGIEAFRGHLLISFISTIIFLKVNKLFVDSNYYAMSAFSALYSLMCKIYDDSIEIKEPNRKMNEISKILNIKLPVELKCQNEMWCEQF